MRIMFVCHGNICRSPMAEFIFKRMLEKAELGYYVASSATSDEEIGYDGVGNPVYPPAKRVLEEHGIDCSQKRAVRLRKDDYNDYDYFVGMDTANIRNMSLLFDGDPENKVIKLNEQDVADPWYTGDFEKAFREIREGCMELLKRLIVEECAT